MTPTVTPIALYAVRERFLTQNRRLLSDILEVRVQRRNQNEVFLDEPIALFVDGFVRKLQLYDAEVFREHVEGDAGAGSAICRNAGFDAGKHRL